MKKYISLFLVAVLMLSLLPMVAFADDTNNGEIPLTEDCFHSKLSYENIGDTHTVTCSDCNTVLGTEAHAFVEGVCVCGAVEQTGPEYILDTNLTFTLNISTGAEMQAFYTIMGAKVNTFESFYLEVVKDVAGSDPITTTFRVGDASNPLTVVGNKVAYQATYTGIYAKEMCDNFRTTLYAVDSNGDIHYSATQVNSIKDSLMGILAKTGSTAALAAQKTMAVDMLNYGAACQVFLNYDVDNLANADLTDAQKALGTAGVPEASAAGAGLTGTGANITGNVSLASKVTLFMTAIGSMPTGDTVLRVENHETHALVTELPANRINANAAQGTFDDVGARNMRTMYDITLYVNGAAASKTLSWSVESYVATERVKTGASEATVNMLNAMLIYGDSVAAYLTASGQ